MTAPAIVDLVATTASATATLTTPWTVAQIGDLVVLIASGTQTAVGTGTPISFNSSGAFTAAGSAVDGSGTGRVRIWYKIIVSGDLSAGIFRADYTSWSNNGTSRIVMAVFRHANGFDSGLVLGTASHNTNAGSASASIGSVSGMARPSVAVAVWGGNGQSTQQFTWDSDSAKDPYFDDGSGSDRDGPNNGTNHFGTGATACQADFKAYDTAETVDLTASVGMNNTTHCALLAVFQTRDTSIVQALGTATETDTAMSLGRTKTRALGTAAETDTALPIVLAAGPNPLGIAVETDIALPFGRTKTYALGTAAETDTAFSFGRAQLIALGTALEEDFAAPVAAVKHSTARFTLTTPSPTGAVRRLRVWAYVAGATDVAQIRLGLYESATLIAESATWAELTTTPTAIELECPGPISSWSALEATIEARTYASAVIRASHFELEVTNTLGTAIEADTALPLARTKTYLFGTATETDTALAFARTKTRALGTAGETDTAIALAASKTRSLGTAVESDTARPFALVTGAIRDIAYTLGSPRSAWTARTPRLAVQASAPVGAWRALAPRT